ncbi:Bcl-2-like protein 1 [Nibea albiflora]|uniref:Bcl-2-like protein 1 n=1 Tax=Nibea albiflora TaxID=240163 RepID=A0ACB7EM77_NIBAL|nr:Bcl-2-like protein 1 [Nibea albiflora]
MGLREPPNRTDEGEAGVGEEQRVATHANGTFNGTSPGTPPESPPQQQQPPSATSMDAVKEALRDSANEFELRYARAFNDLHNQLHITPATAYQSFENVMDEVFRDGVNWGRIVGLFAFGGALCVECVEKEMSPLVGRIIEWMTVYLDIRIQPWIQSQGGWSPHITLTLQPPNSTGHVCRSRRSGTPCGSTVDRFRGGPRSGPDPDDWIYLLA